MSAGGAQATAASRPLPRPGLQGGVLLVALLGAAVAGYLTWVHYAGIQPLCAGGGGGCERVQSSPYAELAGIPVAVLGLLAYLAVAATALLRTAGAAMVGAALAVAGLAFSAYLTYLELFVIEAICQWCVASAVIMAGLAGLTVARALKF